MYIQYTLKNGLTVLLISRPYSKQGAIVIGSRVGSRLETPNNNGIFHLTEHAILEGSQRFPSVSLIERTVDAMAGELNAYLDKDVMMFFFKVPSRYLLDGLELLSDIVLHPLLEPSAIQKEKKSILEEINADLDDLLVQAEELFDETLFAPHPLALRNGGTKECVHKLHTSAVERCWRRVVKPNNLAVTVIGNFKVETMKKRITQTFAHLRPRFSLPPARFLNTQAERRIAALYRQSEQINFYLGFPTFEWSSNRYYTMAVLNNILGGKSSSRLYEKTRGKKGIVYFIDSMIWHYHDIGCLFIQTACSSANALELLTIIIDELKRIKNEKVSGAELHETQTHLKGRAVLEFENELYAAKFYAGQLLRLGRIIPVNTYKKGIEAVKRLAVQKLAQRYFLTEKLNLAMVGSIDDQLRTEIEKILVL